jgi:hypothetical protein
VATVIIPILLLLSIDTAFTQFLPPFIPGIRKTLIGILIMFPSFSSYSMSKKPEFIIPATTIIIGFLYSLPPYVSVFLLGNTDQGGFAGISSFLVAVLFLPWMYFVYLILRTQIFKIVQIATIFALYLGFIFGSVSISLLVLGTSAWCIFSILQLQPLYRSSHTIRGQALLLSSFFFLFATQLGLYLRGSDIWVSLAVLGVDLWLYLIWLSIFFNSEVLILTSGQTLDLVESYYQTQLQQAEECVVFENIDRYLRAVPEDVMYKVDNDALTMTWISLQRTDR